MSAHDPRAQTARQCVPTIRLTIRTGHVWGVYQREIVGFDRGFSCYCFRAVGYLKADRLLSAGALSLPHSGQSRAGFTRKILWLLRCTSMRLLIVPRTLVFRLRSVTKNHEFPIKSTSRPVVIFVLFRLECEPCSPLKIIIF